MEKINIAELLKNCPNGMELDCTIWNSEVKVFLKEVRNADFTYPIVVTVKYNNIEYSNSFTKYGAYNDYPYCKCVLFPKGKTTWEGFVPPCKFKEGDIISDSLGTCIFKGEGIIQGTVDYYCGISSGYFNVKDNECRPDGHYGNIVDYRLATEEEKEKLFQAIKDYGYKWNDETKTLEKLQPYKEETMEGNIKEKCDLINFNSHYIFDFADRVELVLKDDWEVKNEGGRTYVVRKKPKCPNTYEECCEVLGYEPDRQTVTGYDAELIENLQTLKLCRDAYWKIAGEQMGFGKPWKPDWEENNGGYRYCIRNQSNKIVLSNEWLGENYILSFPTKEMCDTFYENFKDLIENVKELL